MTSRRTFRIWRSCHLASLVSPRAISKHRCIAMEETLSADSDNSSSEMTLRCHYSKIFSASSAARSYLPVHSERRLVIIQRLYCSHAVAEDGKMPYENEMVKKFGWLLKLLAAVTLTYVSFNAIPIMGDSLIWQSVALVRCEDPFLKRSGASRIAWIATNDSRRKNFVEAGGVKELTDMLKSAADDKTRHEAIKVLVALCHCDLAVEALHETGAEGFVRSLASGSSDSGVQSQSTVLLQQLMKWKQDSK